MWQIRPKNRYFYLPLIPPFLAIITVTLSQTMFYLLLRATIFNSESYSWLYPLNVRLSLGNLIFVYICPIFVLMTIIFFILKKITLLECIVDAALNSSIPFFVLYVVITVNGA